MKPKRIQRRRSRGWQMPPNAVYVGRPTKWGNPYRMGGNDEDRRAAVDAYRRLFEEPPSKLRHMILTVACQNDGRGEGAAMDMRTSLHELRGKDLACWCPLDQPCHADVLLDLANRD